MNKDINTSVRNKELRFYKEDGDWYADVAEHTQAENRMVAGADALIESFARGGNEVRIVLSADVDDPNPYQIKLKRIEHDAWGATYLAHIKASCCRVRRGFAMSHTLYLAESIRAPSTFILLLHKEVC